MFVSLPRAILQNVLDIYTTLWIYILKLQNMFANIFTAEISFHPIWQEVSSLQMVSKQNERDYFNALF